MTDAASDTSSSDTADLERMFGDAADPANPVGRDALLAADEAGELSDAGVELLDRFGLNAHFVPTALGGRFDSLERLIDVMRAVYRRDPCLGLGYGASSFMAGVNVWLAGDGTQREWLAARLLAGRPVSCAYHELDHGNDLSRVGLTALPGADRRLRLNGRKDVVANLRRAPTMVLFARTDAAQGGRSHSQLLLDVEALPPGAIRHRERYPTSGMRGVQLGGVEFDDCPVPEEGIVGRRGLGVETALRSFQLTRIALPGMTIGLLDTALRTALRGARERRLYGGAAADLPLSRTVLAEAFADLLMADMFTTVAARSVHTATAHASVYAAAAKALVPKVLMQAVYRLSELLGSQFYLRRGRQAFFQKVLRDVQPSAFGHASRVSCQATMLPQLPLTARRGWTAEGAAEGARELPPSTFIPGAPLPDLDFETLAVTGSGRDPLARSLAAGAARASDGDQTRAAAGRWCDELDRLSEAARTLRPDLLGHSAPPSAFRLTTRWTGVLAASACLNLWWHSSSDGGTPHHDATAVLAALHRLEVHMEHHRRPLPADLVDPLYSELVRRLEAGLTFDIRCRPTGA